MNYQNPFVDGINLKRGCGTICRYLRCGTDCPRAKIMAGGKEIYLKMVNHQLKGMLIRDQRDEADAYISELAELGIISENAKSIFIQKFF
jgi:hypothetical protein